MPCVKCSSEGRLLCEGCVRALTDRLLDDERRSMGAYGFRPVNPEGADLVRFLMDHIGPAVNWLHAAAKEMTDPERAAGARSAADALHAAYKRAREELRRQAGAV